MLLIRLLAGGVFLLVPLHRWFEEFHEISEARFAGSHRQLRVEVGSDGGALSDLAGQAVRRATNARRPQVPGRIPVEPLPGRFGTRRSGIFVFRTDIAEDRSVVTAPNKVVDDIDHPGNSSVADDQTIPDVEEPASKTFAGLSPTVHDAMDDIQGVDRPRPPFPIVEDHPHVDVVDLAEGHPGIGDEADLVTVALDAVERPVPHPVSPPNHSANHNRCQPTWPGSNGLVPSTTGRCHGSQLPADSGRAIVGQRRALPHRSFPH